MAIVGGQQLVVVPSVTRTCFFPPMTTSKASQTCGVLLEDWNEEALFFGKTNSGSADTASLWDEVVGPWSRRFIA